MPYLESGSRSEHVWTRPYSNQHGKGQTQRKWIRGSRMEDKEVVIGNKSRESGREVADW